MGLKEKMINNPTNNTIYGVIAFEILSKGTPETVYKTYKTIPTGGVNNPIIKFNIIMIPK